MEIRQSRAIETTYKDYYDSLGPGELAEQDEWGKFAESELTKGIR